MKKIFSMIACLIFINQVHAKKDIYSSIPINWNTSNSIPLLSVPAPPINTFIGFLDYKTKTLNSYVQFRLNTSSIPAGLGSFTAQLNVTIKYCVEGQNTPVTVNKLMTINYDNLTG
jgi:hypothetical protein